MPHFSCRGKSLKTTRSLLVECWVCLYISIMFSYYSLLYYLELLSCILLSGAWPVLIDDFVEHMYRFVCGGFYRCNEFEVESS